MGACVSIHMDSAYGSKQDEHNNKKQQLLIQKSPTKISISNKPNGIAQWPPISDTGSKDESFFDSQAWLESDCEDDDFVSVRGDFTPSRSNTPLHHDFTAGTTKVNDALSVNQTTLFALPNPSPNTQRKKLSDLFKDSFKGNKANENEQEDKMSNSENEVSGKLGTPYAPEANSISSNGRKTPNEVFKPVREKSMKSVQWCLPNMLSSCSYTERKKKTSPAPIAVEIN